MTYVYQIIIGLCFTAVYFFVFRFLILKFNIATPGREKEEGQETKLYSKKEYRERKQASKETAAADETQRDTAALYIEALGGKDNITEVTNCATRLRVTVADESKVKNDADFRELGAHGVVRKGRALQVIVGLGVPQMRERIEQQLDQ